MEGLIFRILRYQLIVLNSGYWPDWSIKWQCYWSSVVYRLL